MGRINLKDKIKHAQIVFSSLSRSKKAGGVFLVVIIGVLLYESLLAAHNLRLKALDLQFNSQHKLLTYYNGIVKNAPGVVNKLKEKENEFICVEEKFVREGELSDYFAHFRQLVGSYNLQAISLDFKPQEPLEGPNESPLIYYQKLPFEVSIKGNYFNIMLFLERLGQNKPIFKIQGIDINQEDPDSFVVSADIKAEVYILLNKDKEYASE